MSNHIAAAVASVALLIAFAGCSASKAPKAQYAGGGTHGHKRLVTESREMAQGAMKEKSRSKKKELALAGVDAAERCLMTAPENPGCYYWRAANTGLYHSVHIIGYQKGIKRMISDCEKVNSLDADYEHAGAYRMLGQIFTQLPQTAGRPDSVVRDLDRAEGYLRKAVQFAPDYPENHLALAEALAAQGKGREALEALAQADEMAPRWKKDASYDQWRGDSLALRHKIDKRSN